MGTIETREEQLTKAIRGAIHDAKTQPGWQVPNGATLLAQHQLRELPHGNEYIVLCVTPGFQPYVVWIRMIGAEQLADGRSYGPIDYCFSGRYFRTLTEALDYYKDTIGEEEV